MVSYRFLLPSTYLVPFFNETAHHRIGIGRIRFKRLVGAPSYSNDEPQPPTNRCAYRDARRSADNATCCAYRRPANKTDGATRRCVRAATGSRVEPSSLDLVLAGVNIILSRLTPLKLEMGIRPQQRLRPRARRKT